MQHLTLVDDHDEYYAICYGFSELTVDDLCLQVHQLVIVIIGFSV